MSSSGEAAEQVVRIGLEGTEMALKLSGTGAKHLAVLLYSILSEKNKTAGKTRVVNMLRSGKELKIFTIKEEDLKKFSQEARRYGVLYCALREKKPAEGSEVEVMVKEDDAARVNRIVDKLKLASVDIGKAVADVEKTKDGKDEAAHGEQDKGVEGKDAAARAAEEAARKPVKKQTPSSENPTPAKTEKSRRSGSTSDARGTSTRGGGGESSRKSVKKEMEGIRKEQQRRAERQRERERERADARDANRRGREPVRGSKEKDEEGRPR
jgi:hypothetical protein